MAFEIRTDRLELHRLSQNEAEWMTACVQDPRVHRNVGRIPPNQTLEQTRAFLKRSSDSWDAGEGYGFVIEAGALPIGVVGGGFGGHHGPLFDIGYWLSPVAWGFGYATEAASAYVRWLSEFVGLKALGAGYFADNPASGRVLRKLGFLPCGRSTYDCLGRREQVDCIDMARIA